MTSFPFGNRAVRPLFVRALGGTIRRRGKAVASAARRVARVGPAVRLFSGVLLAGTIAIAAVFLADHYGAPAMLFALFIGMAFNFLSSDEKCAPGVDFASRHLLRTGVALLGARITFEQLGSLGLAPILLIAAAVPATMIIGYAADRLLGRDGSFGLLTSGAVAICGASAALALSAVLPQRRDQRDVIFTVIAVTGLSTLAMIAYPVVFAFMGFDARETGILIGATIHDVAQVVGAAYAISDETGDVATYVKLLRVALLPVVILLLSLRTRSSSGVQRMRLPSFMLWFVLILVVNSLGLVPEPVRMSLVDASGWLLVTAIAALGVRTSIGAIVELGGARLALVVGETLFLLSLAVAGIALS